MQPACCTSGIGWPKRRAIASAIAEARAERDTTRHYFAIESFLAGYQRGKVRAAASPLRRRSTDCHRIDLLIGYSGRSTASL